MIWQPTLGIFKIDHAMPLGKYEFEMSPYSDPTYKIRAIESLVAKTPRSGTTENDYDFKVNDLFFYAATMNAPTLSDGQYLIDRDLFLLKGAPKGCDRFGVNESHTHLATTLARRHYLA